jgi:hypothetical protein
VDIVADLPADTQPAEPVQQGETLLNHPAVHAQPGAMLGAAPRSAPKPGKPGPGRPPGSRNRRPAPRHDVGKTTNRDASLKARRERAG